MEKDWYEYPLCTDAHYYYYKVEYFYNGRIFYETTERDIKVPDNNPSYLKHFFLKDMYDLGLITSKQYEKAEAIITPLTEEEYYKKGLNVNGLYFELY